MEWTPATNSEFELWVVTAGKSVLRFDEEL